MLLEILDTTLTFCLAPEVTGTSGLSRTAYDDDDPTNYRHGNTTEWGYMMQGWCIAAEKGRLTQQQAVERLDQAISSLESLRADPDQSWSGLFYNYYYVRNIDGTPMLLPERWTDGEMIPSIDNALLTAALVVIEGWAIRHSESSLAARCRALWTTMNYRPFLKSVAGGKAISHGYKPATGELLSSVYDVTSDEGGMMSWIAFLTDSITLDEFRQITASQKRWHGKTGAVTVPEAQWFSAMFAWGVRQLGGFPATPRETGIRNRYWESFTAAVSGHLAQAARQGIYYPAYSDAMTQLYTGNNSQLYATPNLSGQEGIYPHIVPHALFVPLNIAPELDASTLDVLFDKIAALKADTANYYHAGADARKPFGFEVVASPNHNAAGYAGITAEGGRYVFETLSQFYILGSIYNALAANDGTPSFVDDACRSAGYRDKLTTVLNALYPACFRVPQDFATVQAAIGAAIHGDIVTIAPGEYVENLVLNKGISLIGSRGGILTPDDTSDDTTINGSNLSRVVEIDVQWPLDDVRLDGLTVVNGGLRDGAGVYACRAAVSIQHCRFADCVTHHSGMGGTAPAFARSRTLRFS